MELAPAASSLESIPFLTMQTMTDEIFAAGKRNEARPGIFGATVHTPQLTAIVYRYAAGSSWEEHQHPQDQVTAVLSGAIDFVVDGQPVRLTEGQLAALPGGTRHSASVSEPAVSLNILTHRDAPPSV